MSVNEGDDAQSNSKHKRQRLQEDDEVVGLDVGGRLFYTHRSTVTTLNAKGSTLATLIDGGDSFSPGCREYKDSAGRTVYFIDRSGDIFSHVLDYLRKNTVNLPSFAQRPDLWRDIREEAEYFGIEGLSERMYVTHEIKRNELARGIFYWLGTKKGSTEEYINPCDRNEIKIFDGTYLQREGHSQFWDAGHTTPVSVLVQYKAPVMGFLEHDAQNLAMCDARPKCSFFGVQFSVVVDLVSILLRPSAYSLRHSGQLSACKNWNLEASLDGGDDDADWDILHEARSDANLRQPHEMDLHVMNNFISAHHSNGNAQKEALEMPLGFAERRLRHTWDIQGVEENKFYRFFRLKAASDSDPAEGLDAVGFELFGEIHEL